MERVQQYQALLKVGLRCPARSRPACRAAGGGLTLCPPGADPQQGEERAELCTSGAGLRGGVGPAAARGEPAARVAHGELPRHPGGAGRAHPPGRGCWDAGRRVRGSGRGLGRAASRGRVRGLQADRGGCLRAAVGGRFWAGCVGWGLTSGSRRATLSYGRGHRGRGCPGRATTATSSCSVTTWWSASPEGIPALTLSAMSSGT